MSAKQWKLILVGVVIALSVWYLYPTLKWYSYSSQTREEKEKAGDKILQKIINLGLDLKGGMHLVLEVDTTKIPKGTTEADAMERAIEILRNRVDQFGVTEPVIQKQGDNLVLVQLPGVKEPQRAIELIGKTALLEFKLVDDTNKLADALQGKIPEGYELLKDQNDESLLVRKNSELTGAALSNARVKIGGQYNMPYIAIDFNEEGAKTFATVTGNNINRRLAIVLDGKVQSAPVIRSKIPDGHAIIEGNFTMEDASSLAIVLRAGALPAPVNIIENRTIGPSLGMDSIKAGLKASAIGLAVVIIFMVVYYGLSGFVADIALLLNLFLLMAAMSAFRATLTLPGIAGIILSLGMAVDANVLIFERVREELRSGKTTRVAIDTGYEKAFSAIVDSNITTLIAAAFLFQFGTGPVKGFAVTLTLGIAISMFTAIIVTRLIFEYALSGAEVRKLSIGTMQFFKKTHFDFIGKRWVFFTISGILIMAGIVSLIAKGGPRLGVDFTGGTLMQVEFRQKPAAQELRAVLEEGGFKNSEIQEFISSNSVVVRVQKSDIPMVEVSRKVEEQLRNKWGGEQIQIKRVEMVGPRVGETLSEQALWAIILSWLGIIIYVAFRFKSGVYGVAGVIALVHDVTVTVGIFSLLNKEITLNIIAALLTLIGYSINDTIVIYDRIRENTRLLRDKSQKEMLNISLNDTMSRTIITSLTVFLVLVALFFWGGEVIHDFALALLIGVITGSYSTIGIATQLVYEWHDRKRKKLRLASK